jgi:hypothetical protein
MHRDVSVAEGMPARKRDATLPLDVAEYERAARPVTIESRPRIPVHLEAEASSMAR